VARPGVFERLEAATGRFLRELKGRAKAAGVPFTANQAGSMFGLFFTDAENVTCYAQATACDADAFKRFFHGALDAGVYLAPSAFEAGFMSAAHDDGVLDAALDALSEAFVKARDGTLSLG